MEHDHEKKYDDGGEAGHSVGPAHDGDYVDPNTHVKTINSEGKIVDGPGTVGEMGQVHRTLQQRHMAMIAIGGAIGTGLFIGSGASLASGGPVGVWLGYCIMATNVYAMMVALGEMCALFPTSGAFTHYAARFADPALGFATGVNYWYSYAITAPTEIVAATIVISYWDTTTPSAAYITVMMVAIWAINFMGARWYGEAEFWFSSIKVITIVGLIILSLILMCGGGPNHDPIGFRYWVSPGPFNHVSIDAGDGFIPGSWGQFLAFWNVFVQAAFSFIGTEIIATTVGEAQNPRKTVPKAIRRVFYRLLFFYVFGIFFISVLVPYDEPNLLSGTGNAIASPFVIAIETAGIKVLPSIVNAGFLISAWSAGNSDIYAASRTLYALALQGQMPKIFRKCTKRGLPVWCVVITSVFSLLAYLNTGGDTAVTAFTWLYNLSAITGILTWWTILFSYLRFYYGLKKQGLSRDDFPYKAPFQPWLSWYGIIFFTLVLIFNGFTVFLQGNWNVSNFFAAYITIPIFILCWAGWKVVKKTKFIPLDQIDFTTGRRELDEMEARDNLEYKPTSTFGKISGWLF